MLRPAMAPLLLSGLFMFTPTHDSPAQERGSHGVKTDAHIRLRADVGAIVAELNGLVREATEDGVAGIDVLGTTLAAIGPRIDTADQSELEAMLKSLKQTRERLASILDESSGSGAELLDNADNDDEPVDDDDSMDEPEEDVEPGPVVGNEMDEEDPRESGFEPADDRTEGFERLVPIVGSGNEPVTVIVQRMFDLVSRIVAKAQDSWERREIRREERRRQGASARDRRDAATDRIESGEQSGAKERREKSARRPDVRRDPPKAPKKRDQPARTDETRRRRLPPKLDLKRPKQPMRPAESKDPMKEVNPLTPGKETRTPDRIRRPPADRTRTTPKPPRMPRSEPRRVSPKPRPKADAAPKAENGPDGPTKENPRGRRPKTPRPPTKRKDRERNPGLDPVPVT